MDELAMAHIAVMTAHRRSILQLIPVMSQKIMTVPEIKQIMKTHDEHSNAIRKSMDELTTLYHQIVGKCTCGGKCLKQWDATMNEFMAHVPQFTALKLPAAEKKKKTRRKSRR